MKQLNRSGPHFYVTLTYGSLAKVSAILNTPQPLPSLLPLLHGRMRLSAQPGCSQRLPAQPAAGMPSLPPESSTQLCHRPRFCNPNTYCFPPYFLIWCSIFTITQESSRTFRGNTGLHPNFWTQIQVWKFCKITLNFDNLLEGLTEVIDCCFPCGHDIPEGKKIGKPPGKSQMQKTSCPLRVESGCMAFRSWMSDNSLEVLSTREAFLSLGVQFYWVPAPPHDWWIGCTLGWSQSPGWLTLCDPKPSCYVALLVFLLWSALTLLHFARLCGMTPGHQVNRDIPIRHKIPRVKARLSLWARPNYLLCCILTVSF